MIEIKNLHLVSLGVKTIKAQLQLRLIVIQYNSLINLRFSKEKQKWDDLSLCSPANGPTCP